MKNLLKSVSTENSAKFVWQELRNNYPEPVEPETSADSEESNKETSGEISADGEEKNEKELFDKDCGTACRIADIFNKLNNESGLPTDLAEKIKSISETGSLKNFLATLEKNGKNKINLDKEALKEIALNSSSLENDIKSMVTDGQLRSNLGNISRQVAEYKSNKEDEEKLRKMFQ